MTALTVVPTDRNRWVTGDVPNGSGCDNTDDDAPRMVREDPQAIDKILSTSLYRLSLKDRNAMDEEIHGVSTVAPDESPGFLDRALDDLSVELGRIPDHQKTKYHESQVLPNTYVNTRSFRLRFLRSELFDARLAARRMVRFLDFAADLFGPQVLQRPIKVTDFKGDDRKLLQTGNAQLLPFRERSGRPVFCWVGDFALKEGTVRGRHKVGFYLVWCLSEDVASQRTGMTQLVWVGKNQDFMGSFPGWENMEYHRKLTESIPLRMSCIHFCCPDLPYYHWLRSAFGIMMHHETKFRLRFHVGPEIELLYKLKTYGVPVELIPVTQTGTIKTTYWKQWMKVRKDLEALRDESSPESAALSSSRLIVCPRVRDVVFRHGTNVASHPGNAGYQSLLESRLAEHLAGTQNDKIRITRALVREIREAGGRFLQYDSRGCWTELTEESAIHSKVSVSFKHFKKGRLAQNSSSLGSGTLVFANQDHRSRKRRKLLAAGLAANTHQENDEREKDYGCLRFSPVSSDSSSSSCADICDLF